MTIVEQKIGGFGIVQKNKNGTISQIGLTEEQYNQFEIFLVMMSSQKPFYKLPKKYDLVPKDKL